MDISKGIHPATIFIFPLPSFFGLGSIEARVSCTMHLTQMPNDAEWKTIISTLVYRLRGLTLQRSTHTHTGVTVSLATAQLDMVAAGKPQTSNFNLC